MYVLNRVICDGNRMMYGLNRVIYSLKYVKLGLKGVIRDKNIMILAEKYTLSARNL